MKANELMIGDWVNVSVRNKIAQVYRIDMANGVGNEYAAVLDGDACCTDLAPIPLTPEILENNGYKDNGALMYIQYLMEKDNRCRVSIIEASGGYQVMVNSILCSPKAIHYVHELQHALRLCGIEKEIVL